MKTFQVKPSEGGTGLLDGSFYDTGNSSTDPKKVTPVSALWDLRDRNGEIINSRENILVFDPGPILEDWAVTLTCADLLIAVENEEDIYFTIHGIYDSDEGSDLCFTKQGKIIIDEVIGVGVK